VEAQVKAAIIGGLAVITGAFVTGWLARGSADRAASRGMPLRDPVDNPCVLFRGRVLSKVLGPRRLSEGDILAELESWMGNRPSHLNRKVIRYSDVDAALRLPAGSAKKHVKSIAARRDYVVVEEGDDSVLLQKRPYVPQRNRWMSGALGDQ